MSLAGLTTALLSLDALPGWLQSRAVALLPTSDADDFGKPRYEVAVAQHVGFARVTISGKPTLDQMLSIIRVIGLDSVNWSTRAVLFDLRKVASLFSRPEQFRLGEEAALSLVHMEKLASLVPPQRLTRISEKAARSSGSNMTVFTSKEEALAWVRG